MSSLESEARNRPRDTSKLSTVFDEKAHSRFDWYELVATTDEKLWKCCYGRNGEVPARLHQP